MCSSVFSKPTDAFTLIELLSVISIIGILVALSVAGIGKFRDNARTSVTLSNLKQLQAANMAYAADNNGLYVKAFNGGTWEDGWRGNADFLNYIGRAGTDGWSNPSKIVRSGFPQANALIAYNIPRAPGPSGVINYWQSGPMQLRQSNLERPSTTIAFIDANDWWVDPGKWNTWTSAKTNDGKPKSGAALVAYRNAGKAAAVTFAGNAVLLGRADMNVSTPEGKWRWYFDGK
jgi:prepilin-type N-terminal cleavage/methylation domain-containing protein